MTELDVDFVRSRFPALDTPWALFDNAGGSVPCRQVVDRVTDYLSRLPVQLGASYGLSVEAGEAVERGRAAAATLYNASPEEMVIGPSSTQLVQTLSRALRPLWEAGDEVIVTNVDHETNVGPWRDLEATGIAVREWRFRPDPPRLELEDLEPLLGERTRLVAFCHCSNVVGTIHDVRAIARRVREAGALSCVDGVAYAPHRRVDVQALGADFYFASLYKVYGPHLAALFGQRELLLAAKSQNHFFVGEDRIPVKLEPGNINYELTASLAGILEYADEVDRHHHGEDGADVGTRLARTFDLFAQHEERLAAPVLGYLAERPDVRIVGLPGADHARRVPTISFTVDGVDSSTIPPQLDERGVAIRYGHFYAYRPVRDLGLLDTNGVVRISMAHYNTAPEVERLIEALDGALE